jgi:hypothetical protein
MRLSGDFLENFPPCRAPMLDRNAFSTAFLEYNVLSLPYFVAVLLPLILLHTSTSCDSHFSSLTYLETQHCHSPEKLISVRCGLHLMLQVWKANNRLPSRAYLFSELPETSSSVVNVMGNDGLFTPGEIDTPSTVLTHGSDVQRGVCVEADGTNSPSEPESKILQEQIDVPEVKATYMTLYRYALILFSCAVAAGAALPLMIVSIQYRYQGRHGF